MTPRGHRGADPNSRSAISKASKSATGTRFRRRPTPSVSPRAMRPCVGLDRTEICDQLRERNGRQPSGDGRPAEVFEPADPARTMPKWLVFGAIAAVLVLVLVMSWLNKRSLDQPTMPTQPSRPRPPRRPRPPPGRRPRLPQPGAVVMTATEPVWLQVNEKGGAMLFCGRCWSPAKALTVPPTATAPVLKTGKPEALRITVGNSVAPPVGPPATTVSNVSLLPADLMQAGARQRPPATAAPSPPAAAATPDAAQAPALPPPRRPRARAPTAADQHYRLSRDSSPRKPRRGTIARLPSVGNSSEIIPSSRPACRIASLALDSGPGAGPAPAADARTAPRPARATDPADAAPGLPARAARPTPRAFPTSPRRPSRRS